MGHDTHFLARLDRVSDAHVERALTLYRDEALLKEVLNRAGLAEGVERLAISLDDPREGPFVVVTREGRFVTAYTRLPHPPHRMQIRLEHGNGAVVHLRGVHPTLFAGTEHDDEHERE